MDYRGFEITEHPISVTYNGKQVFTAHWQQPVTIRDAKELIDISLAAKAAFAKLPNKGAALTKLTGNCELENGNEAAGDFERWVESESEKQLSDV